MLRDQRSSSDSSTGGSSSCGSATSPASPSRSGATSNPHRPSRSPYRLSLLRRSWPRVRARSRPCS
jgi:hypothetical protein